MGIKVKNISVKNLGPIPELIRDLGNINLIFGHNEKGKSYLVEFLIHSLFRASGWTLRNRLGSGRIEVEGLADGITAFSPSSSKKLEDSLSSENEYIGLPPDFSKLLVLRGTDVELGKEEESDRIMLRRYLSHKEILDRIKIDMPTTVRKWSIDRYNINGDERDRLIKGKQNLEQNLRRINQLFTDVENNVLGGEIKRLKDGKEELDARRKELEKAKRYKAYQVSTEIQKLSHAADQIDEERIERLLEEVNQLRTDQDTYEKGERQLKSLKKSTEHYEWLAQAIEEYEKYKLEETKLEPNKLFPIALGVLAVATGILIASLTKDAIWVKWVALVLLGISVVIGFIYKREYNRSVAQYGKRKELLHLKEDYGQKFGEELSNLAVMSARRVGMQEEYSKKRVLEEQLGKDSENIRRKEAELAEEIAGLFGEEIDIGGWKKRLKDERARKRELENQASKKKIELADLKVDERDYVRSKPEAEFDQDKYGKVSKDLEEVQRKIEEKEREVERLKHSICELTADDALSIDWMKLIENLADKRKKTLGEYKELKAEIIASYYISRVIEELYNEEDEKIKEALESEVIKETLLKVTTHYNSIYLEDDRLIVSDQFHDFPVSEISDGAREQVFLALRIGLAMHWFEKDGLFLILDDAFIHSDDKRRPELVDKVLELGGKGWQILCFTFDGRIKELFDEHGEEYEFINLDEL